ncbi:MAG: endonuclease III domain-containing protein [Candidatus Latescibacteria bacterium]|nr:endonuclease III domain-containing protein [Candidatus Latescibacterota bacterium]
MKSEFQRLYQQLYRHFGSQGWWPTTPPGETRPRYYPGQVGRPLSEDEQWEIAVGALLTQNTAWRNAEQALEALHRHGALALQALAGLEERQLAALIRSSGYYNQKARRLQHLARHVATHHQGELGRLLDGPTRAVRAELLALPGIGPETADSILLYAGGHPVFVVDAYTRRICSRLGWVGEGTGHAALQELFMKHLPAAAALFNEYHALLVRLATSYCRSRPQCAACPLRRWCRHGQGQDH